VCVQSWSEGSKIVKVKREEEIEGERGRKRGVRGRN
jgi:hypothetical protein